MGQHYFKKFDVFMRSSFRRLGHLVADYPLLFFIIPPLISIIMGTGLLKINYVTEPEYIFSPYNGQGKSERRLIQNYFKDNYSEFYPGRIISPGKFAQLIITTKDESTILSQEVWDEVIRLDKWVKDLTILDHATKFTFEELCAQRDVSCVGNQILNLYGLLPQILNGSLALKYPIMIDPRTFEAYLMSIKFGGFTVGQDGDVEEIKSIFLSYWLRSATVADKRRGDIWERLLLDTFEAESFELIKIARFTSHSLEEEFHTNVMTVVPLYICLTTMITIIFCMVALWMSDWVRAKPWLGVLGITSVGFALMASYGFLMHLGVPFLGINMASPFLMLGIGADDMFILLASWRRTSVQDSVKKRMGESFSEAAVSITITSLTDMISFFIGVMTPFPSIRIFCLYSGTAVFAVYIFQLTFFGACLAFDGRRESERRHALLFMKVKPKSVSEKEDGPCYTVWCAGGINPDDPHNPKDTQPHLLLGFMERLANILKIPQVKALVLALFLVYLGGAFYGFFVIEEGLKEQRIMRYDSYAKDYFDMKGKYFREYPYRIQVMVTGDLVYSNSSTKQQLLDLHKDIENLPWIAEELYTNSWIREWYLLLDTTSRYFGIDITDEENFIYYLRNIYLNGGLFQEKKLDIKFNEDFSRIVASRFMVQASHIPDSTADVAMMMDLRKVAEESPLNVTVYHPEFVFIDHLPLVRHVCIQTISIAAVVMMIMSLVFIPNPWCSLWVAFSMISIEVGVVGYMAHWGVYLDGVSCINLIMCIGFSVDFSAHISYAYLSATADTPHEKVKESLTALGLPILGGAISTILGSAALAFAPSYVFLAFFKTIFLVMFFGALHGLLLLPVLLSLLGPGRQKSKRSPAVACIKENEHDREPHCSHYYFF